MLGCSHDWSSIKQNTCYKPWPSEGSSCCSSLDHCGYNVQNLEGTKTHWKMILHHDPALNWLSSFQERHVLPHLSWYLSNIPKICAQTSTTTDTKSKERPGKRVSGKTTQAARCSHHPWPHKSPTNTKGWAETSWKHLISNRLQNWDIFLLLMITPEGSHLRTRWTHLDTTQHLSYPTRNFLSHVQWEGFTRLTLPAKDWGMPSGVRHGGCLLV